MFGDFKDSSRNHSHPLHHRRTQDLHRLFVFWRDKVKISFGGGGEENPPFWGEFPSPPPPLLGTLVPSPELR